MSTLRLASLAALMPTLLLPPLACAVAPPPRVDAAGFLLPAKARLRLGTISWGMPGHVSVMDASADGKLLAVGTIRGHLRVLDLTTGAQRQTWQLRGDVSAVSFANHGRTLVVDLAESVHLFDVVGGKEVGSFQRLARTHPPPAVSRDGSTVAVFGKADNPRCIVQLVDPATGRITLRKELSAPKVYRGALSPDGRTLATGHDDATFRLWDTATWKELHRLVGLEEAPHWLTFSPDGSFVAAAKHGRGRAQIWDVKTGKARLTEKERPEGLHFALTPDGRSIALVFEDHVERFDVSTRRTSPWMAGCDLYLNGFAFLPDGKAVAVTQQKFFVQMWDAATGRPRRTLGQPGLSITQVQFVAGGRRLFARHRDGTALWDLGSGRLVNPGRPYLAVSPDGTTGIVTDSPRGLISVNVSSGRVVARYKPSGQNFGGRPRDSAAYFSPDGRTVAFLSWDQSGATRLETFAAGSGDSIWRADHALRESDVSWPSPDGFRFSPSGDLLLSRAYFNSVRVRRLGRMNPHRHGYDLWVWESSTGRKMLPAKEVSIQGDTFLFTPDDRLVLTHGSNDLDKTPGLPLCDLTTGKERRITKAVPDQTGTLALSSDGRFLAVGETSGRIVLWDLRTGVEAGRLEGHAQGVTALAFSPDGSTLASGSGDTTILIWDVSHLLGLKRVKPPAKEDPRRLWLALAGDDGWAAWQAIWRLQEQPREAVALLREKVKPASGVEGARLRQLVDELDSDQFATREAATSELEKIGHRARPVLERTLLEKPSLEQGLRIRRLLARLPAYRLPPTERRALLLLESLAIDDARRLLRELAAGAADAMLTHEAQAALDRLKQK